MRDGGDGAGSVAGSLEDSVYSDMVGGLCRSTGLVPSFIWEENRGAGVWGRTGGNSASQ